MAPFASRLIKVYQNSFSYASCCFCFPLGTAQGVNQTRSYQSAFRWHHPTAEVNESFTGKSLKFQPLHCLWMFQIPILVVRVSYMPWFHDFILVDLIPTLPPLPYLTWKLLFMTMSWWLCPVVSYQGTSRQKQLNQHTGAPIQEATGDGYLLEVTASPTAARRLKSFEASRFLEEKNPGKETVRNQTKATMTLHCGASRIVVLGHHNSNIYLISLVIILEISLIAPVCSL